MKLSNYSIFYVIFVILGLGYLFLLFKELLMLFSQIGVLYAFIAALGFFYYLTTL